MTTTEIKEKIESLDRKISLVKADMAAPETYEGEFTYLLGVLDHCQYVRKQLAKMIAV